MVHDADAERALVGALLLTPANVPEAKAMVRPEDVWTPALRRIYETIIALHDQGHAVNPTTVTAALAAANGTRRLVYDVLGACPASAAFADYAGIVAGQARARRVLAAAGELARAVRTGAAVPEAERAMRAALDEGTAAAVLPGPDLDEFLAAAEPERAWVVPDLLERGDRLIVTGREGTGKSTLCRQLAVLTGAGVHPFTHAGVPARRTLLVDLENGREYLRRQLRPLRLTLRDKPAPGMVNVVARPDGVDVLTDAGRGWFEATVRANDPDLLVVGPLYKLAGGDPIAEEPARAVAALLDALRVRHGCAVVVEAHSPYGSGEKRPTRPYGASLWSRWPEFGVHLGDAGILTHWRGARDERVWPVALRRGGAYPFTAEYDAAAVIWPRIVEHIRVHGKATQRELALALGVAKGSVQRTIDRNRRGWEELLAEVEEEPC